MQIDYGYEFMPVAAFYIQYAGAFAEIVRIKAIAIDKNTI